MLRLFFQMSFWVGFYVSRHSGIFMFLNFHSTNIASDINMKNRVKDEKNVAIITTSAGVFSSLTNNEKQPQIIFCGCFYKCLFWVGFLCFKTFGSFYVS